MYSIYPYQRYTDGHRQEEDVGAAVLEYLVKETKEDT